MRYFITATDTDAGKTHSTCLLLESLRAMGRNAVGFKPFACGDRLDALALQRSGGGQLDLDHINPISLKIPASPWAAALLENRPIDVEAARLGFASLCSAHQDVLVEGAGGWEVPLWEDQTMADFAASLQIPILLVVNNRLGCLNHALLTLRNIRQRGLHCAGILLNHVADMREAASISNALVLRHFSQGVPIVAEIMHGETRLDWPQELALD
jgi:dethiobiotin synthetase